MRGSEHLAHKPREWNILPGRFMPRNSSAFASYLELEARRGERSLKACPSPGPLAVLGAFGSINV